MLLITILYVAEMLCGLTVFERAYLRIKRVVLLLQPLQHATLSTFRKGFQFFYKLHQRNYFCGNAY